MIKNRIELEMKHYLPNFFITVVRKKLKLIGDGLKII